MTLSFLRGWREERSRAECARLYAGSLMTEPDEGVVESLAGHADRDADHARWELRYARRAFGLLVAERDALDDRTASEIAVALESLHAADPNVDAERRNLAGRQFNERLGAYRSALPDRRAGPAATAEAGRLLMEFAGVADPEPAALELATGITEALLAECNAALLAQYGEARLPQDIRPSDLPGER